MNVTAREYSSANEMKAAYADRRARLYASRKVAPIAKPHVKVTVMRGNVPLWRRADITFSDHVVAWQLYKASLVTSPVPAYIRMRCAELGFTRDEINSDKRGSGLVRARHLLMWEVWTKFNLSYPMVGHQFGDRDHSSCQHAIKKIAAEMRGRG
jgi:hypothetical protein